MYRELIQSKFTADERNGLYVYPNLPAKKLGKVLVADPRIKQPGDVVAVHMDEGFFGASVVIFTDTDLFYPGGFFSLSEIKAAEADGKTIKVAVNHLGALSDHHFKVGSEEAAHIFKRVLNDIMRFDPNEAAQEAPDYSKFEGQALDWLLLRDEVMRTIDMLQEKFMDGKLSLLEYEEKKEELLARL